MTDTGKELSQSVSGTCSKSFIGSRKLPSKIIGGYASWDSSKLKENEQSIIKAVEEGLNVIYWFSIDLVTDDSNSAKIVSRGPSADFLSSFDSKLKLQNLHVTHLITIGGWNARHPSTLNSPEELYSAWKSWNEGTMADESRGFFGFDGIDWDIEGHDDISSPNNHFTVAVLDTIGRVSQLAKRDGYLVSMAPMESYLDPRTPGFDRSCRLTNPEWQPIVPSFTYHGRNAYAYLLSRYGRTATSAAAAEEEAAAEPSVDTFDLVVLQLYESYSRTGHAITQAGVTPSTALANLARAYRRGWAVDFSADPELLPPPASATPAAISAAAAAAAAAGSDAGGWVSVPPDRLVIGLANAWAHPAGAAAPPPRGRAAPAPAGGSKKTLFVHPRELAPGLAALAREGSAPRGFAYWSMTHDGDPLGPPPPPLEAGGAAWREGEPLHMAAALARAMGVAAPPAD